MEELFGGARDVASDLESMYLAVTNLSQRNAVSMSMEESRIWP
jgi:hypothetical protein